MGEDLMKIFQYLNDKHETSEIYQVSLQLNKTKCHLVMQRAEHQTPHGVWFSLIELLIEVQDVAHMGVIMVHKVQS